MKIRICNFQRLVRRFVTSTIFLSQAYVSANEILSPNSGGVFSGPIKTKIIFESEKKWEAARWYAVGRWVGPNRIDWLGGGQSLLSFPSAKCLSKESFIGSVEKIEASQQSGEALEVLRSGEFFALELSTQQAKENIRVTAGAALKNEIDVDCSVEISVRFAWVKEKSEDLRINPLVFLAPHSNRYYGYEFQLIPPKEKPEAMADVSLDILGGGAIGRFPNATAPGVNSLSLFPVTRARGEWLPFTYYWGMSLTLEQVMASWGGASTETSKQSALYSDWSVGTFWEDFYPVFDAIQIRLGVSYLEHAGDDQPEIPTLLSQNKSSGYVVGTLSTGVFYSDRWLTGLDFAYGPPINLAGVGKQSYMNILGRVGLRVTGFLFLLGEAAYKTYTTEGFAADSVMQLHMGIRLDL